MGALAVLGCTVEIMSGQSSEAIAITTSPSSDVAVSGKGVYFGDIDISLSAITVGNYLCASGTITISGTASSILDKNNNPAVQLNDSATKSLTFVDTTGQTPSQSLPVTIKITNAGQSDVIAN